LLLHSVLFANTGLLQLINLIASLRQCQISSSPLALYNPDWLTISCDWLVISVQAFELHNISRTLSQHKYWHQLSVNLHAVIAGSGVVGTVA
jgi:hypothetical protein